MSDTKKQKEALVTGILLLLSKTYTRYSTVHQMVRDALTTKFSLIELNSLYAMVLTSTDKE